jgi:hypothetical protein
LSPVRAFFLLRLPQPDTRSAAVLVDELAAGRFDRPPNLFGCAFSATELAMHGFKLAIEWRKGFTTFDCV